MVSNPVTNTTWNLEPMTRSSPRPALHERHRRTDGVTGRSPNPRVSGHVWPGVSASRDTELLRVNILTSFLLTSFQTKSKQRQWSREGHDSSSSQQFFSRGLCSWFSRK